MMQQSNFKAHTVIVEDIGSVVDPKELSLPLAFFRNIKLHALWSRNYYADIFPTILLCQSFENVYNTRTITGFITIYIEVPCYINIFI